MKLVLRSWILAKEIHNIQENGGEILPKKYADMMKLKISTAL